jgi:hypothetical protein
MASFRSLLPCRVWACLLKCQCSAAISIGDGIAYGCHNKDSRLWWSFSPLLACCSRLSRNCLMDYQCWTVYETSRLDVRLEQYANLTLPFDRFRRSKQPLNMHSSSDYHFCLCQAVGVTHDNHSICPSSPSCSCIH